VARASAVEPLELALGLLARLVRERCLGDALAIALGVVGAVLLPKVISQPITISGVAAVGAIAVAVGIGVVFGVYPASRAARLAPIDALRGD